MFVNHARFTSISALTSEATNIIRRRASYQVQQCVDRAGGTSQKSAPLKPRRAHPHPADHLLAPSECSCVLSNQLDGDSASDHGRRTLQAGKGDIVFRAEEAVNLGAACLEQFGHPIFGNFAFPHGFVELPRDDLLDRLCLGLLKDAFFLEEIVNTRTHMILALLSFLAHCFNSFWRLRANAKSSSGVARVFLINPCSATRCPRKGRAAHAPCGASGGPSAPPTARFPTAGTAASRPAIAIAHATG